jgi:hypothetical protein
MRMKGFLDTVFVDSERREGQPGGGGQAAPHQREASAARGHEECVVPPYRQIRHHLPHSKHLECFAIMNGGSKNVKHLLPLPR